ncbi:MAG: hypothetical protein KDB35_14370 [Acidimicrobiales bacterium]|nr:hypothetical protein [Acidimicrobiales bacterium]MCB1017953.1 hypothetical protein [Acidimicrobiales bacterium]
MPTTPHQPAPDSTSAPLPTPGDTVDLRDAPDGSPGPDTLYDRWSARSRRELGLSRQQWHHPATKGLVEAVGRGRDLTEPLRALGEARAGAGLSLDELLADLAVLATLAPASDDEPAIGIGRVDTLRAAATAGTAWAEAFYETTSAPGGTDPLTGLATGGFLEARLHQLYVQASHGGRAPADALVLVVVALRCERTSQFSRLARRIRVAGQLRAAFPTSDTVAVLEPTHALVALVPGAPDLGGGVAELAAVTGRDRVWVESLPGDAGGAVALVRELATIPRLPTVAAGADLGHP